MPELPEVEVVRRGLETWTLGAVLGAVQVLHPRAVRRHVGGADDLVARLGGARIENVVRRGKFCWFQLDSGHALVAHLGMSGQLLLVAPTTADEPHLRVRLPLIGGPAAREGRELRFVDLRTFGYLALAELVPVPGGGSAGLGASTVPPPDRLPALAAHIAPDVLDPDLDEDRAIDRIRSRRTGIKRVLLDQRVVSGIGNIYADESLWRAGLHPECLAGGLARARVAELLAAARAVTGEALAAGGTSFDSLYVDVNGRSGYFSRDLAVYGRAGRACRRCGTPIVREPFMNRSSYRCPRCQRR